MTQSNLFISKGKSRETEEVVCNNPNKRRLSWTRKWSEVVIFEIWSECLNSRSGSRMGVWCRSQRGLEGEPSEFSLSRRKMGVAIT